MNSGPSIVSLRATAHRLAERMRDGRPLAFMEICGTHTVSLLRSGVKSLLPPSIRLVSGPGCPVCVTPQGYLDAACGLALDHGVTILSYGDMIRVPGSKLSLAQARAEGARVEVVYSARAAVRYAAEHPQEEVVFLAIGFETTTPASAVTVLEAQAAGVDNLSLLVGHKRVLPAMAALLEDGIPLDGFLCPGHVSVIIGTEVYRPIVRRYGKACVVAGFEPESMLEAICRLVDMVQTHRPGVANCYPVAVRPEGSPRARRLIDQVFRTADSVWRAMGTIPDSGLRLREEYARFDAQRRFDLSIDSDEHPPGCICGEVIQGKCEPAQCTHFGRGCTPSHPIGPCMVSSEGSCAASYKYGRIVPASDGCASPRPVREETPMQEETPVQEETV